MAKRVIRKTRVWHLNVLGYLALVIAIGFAVYRNSVLASEGREAHVAICAFKDDLQRRVDATDELLAEHPEGSIFGIPRELIIQGRKNQQLTIDSLSSLDC
jgi:hypothetical protein